MLGVHFIIIQGNTLTSKKISLAISKVEVNSGEFTFKTNGNSTTCIIIQFNYKQFKLQDYETFIQTTIYI